MPARRESIGHSRDTPQVRSTDESRTDLFRPGSPLHFLSLLVFAVLQVASLPLGVVGAAVVAYKQIFVSKRLGVSQTGIEILNGRWTMHVFGIREDAATARLAAALPNTSTLGLWLFLIPLWVKYKLSGAYWGYPRIPEEGSEEVRDFVVARTLYFDRIIDQALEAVDQFVVLGAGYDTRAYGRWRDEGLTFFELDQDATQTLKVAALRQAGIESDHVSFVTVDFSRDDTFEKLEAAGYDPTKRTLFLWEGVTLYLSERDVRGTLRDIREHAGPGSVVVADLYGQRFIQMGSRPSTRKALEYTNETLSFGLGEAGDFELELRRFIESEGMTLGDVFVMGAATKKGPFMAVAELHV